MAVAAILRLRQSWRFSWLLRSRDSGSLGGSRSSRDCCGSGNPGGSRSSRRTARSALQDRREQRCTQRPRLDGLLLEAGPFLMVHSVGSDAPQILNCVRLELDAVNNAVEQGGIAVHTNLKDAIRKLLWSGGPCGSASRCGQAKPLRPSTPPPLCVSGV